MPTINSDEIDKLWALAKDTGYTTAGIMELLHDLGYDEPEDIPREEFQDVLRYAANEDLVDVFNKATGRSIDRSQSAPPGRP
jgi:hypothetical protein